MSQAITRRIKTNRLALDPDFTVSLAVISRQNIGDYSLAGAVLTQQGVHLSGTHVEIQMIEYQVLPYPRKALGKTARLKQDLSVNRSLWCLPFGIYY